LRDEPVDLDQIRKETEAIYADYFSRAMNFYAAFFRHDG